MWREKSRLLETVEGVRLSDRIDVLSGALNFVRAEDISANFAQLMFEGGRPRCEKAATGLPTPKLVNLARLY